MSQQQHDFINAKSTKTGESKNGAQWTKYVLEGEDLNTFLEKVNELYSNQKAVSIMVFTSEKEGKFGSFLSSNFKIEEHVPGNGGKGGFKKGPTFNKPKFVPKTKTATVTTKTTSHKRTQADIEE